MDWVPQRIQGIDRVLQRVIILAFWSTGLAVLALPTGEMIDQKFSYSGK